MTILNSTTKSLVIQSYLNGRPRDSIAQELYISSGSVSNTIKEWKNQIGMPDAEQIRQFAVLVKKSGISMDQCTQGFRMVQILKNFGIEDNAGEINDHFIRDYFLYRDNLQTM